MSHPSIWDPITIGEVDKAADLFGLVKGSDGVTRRMAAEELLDRLLSSNDLSWMSSFASFAALDSGDGVLVFDADASAVKMLPVSVLMSRLLSSASLSWLTSFANMAAVDRTADSFLAVDASDGVLKALAVNDVLLRVVTNKTYDLDSSQALTAAHAGALVTNAGASGVVTYTFPAADVLIRFARDEDHDIIVTDGSATITLVTEGQTLDIERRGGALRVVGGSGLYL